MVLYALQHTPTYLAIKHSKDTNQSELPHWKGHLASMSKHPKWNAKSAPQTAHDNDDKPTPLSYHDFHKPTPCNTHKQTSLQWAQVPQTNKQRRRRRRRRRRRKRRRRRQQRLRSRRRKRNCTYVMWLSRTNKLKNLYSRSQRRSEQEVRAKNREREESVGLGFWNFKIYKSNIDFQ